MEDQYAAFYKTIGDRIRKIRIAKGMSQAELAEKAQLSLPAISTLENGHSMIWLITFAKIAEALQVSADDILRLDTPASTENYPAAFKELLSDCNPAEKEAILNIAKQVKSTFQSQKKDNFSGF